MRRSGAERGNRMVANAFYGGSVVRVERKGGRGGLGFGAARRENGEERGVPGMVGGGDSTVAGIDPWTTGVGSGAMVPQGRARVTRCVRG
jgi:hypothetical protein